MYTEFEIFVKTLEIGEQLFSLSYTDYQDAYDYSHQFHSEISKHLLDFFENHSDEKKGEYEYDLMRYIFIKAMEQRISSDLYAHTSRGNVCDIFHSPFDIHLDYYPTNLPKHIEKAVNDYQREGHAIANSIMDTLDSDKFFSFGEEVLNALQFLGQTVGYHVGQDNRTYNGYNCSDMLTRNEINKIAGSNVCKYVMQKGFEIEEVNFSRDTYQNIVASKDGKRIFILITAEIAPEDPGFIPLDLDNLYSAAESAGAVPFYASVSLGSVDDKHFSDGVLLFEDAVRFRINAFGELEKE